MGLQEQPCTQTVYMGIPRFSSSLAESGDVAFGRAGSLAAVVADDFVDLNDDVLRDAGLYGSAIKIQPNRRMKMRQTAK